MKHISSVLRPCKMLFFIRCPIGAIVTSWSQVTSGKTGMSRVQQVMGLMERLVITLQSFIAMEPLLKINYASGQTLEDYL